MIAKGIDVSSHQGRIDWARVKAAGIQFAIIRAGYGLTFVDEQFHRNIKECNRLDIPCGAYWFSYATNAKKARQEALEIIKLVKPYRLEYPVCFDLEYDTLRYAKEQGVTIGKVQATAHAEAFLSEVEAAGYYAMNYANRDYLINMFDAGLLKKYDLWYAFWAASKDRDCGIWQYSSKGRVDGINGNVDMNHAFKDYPAIMRQYGLNGFAKAGAPPAAPSKPKPDPEPAPEPAKPAEMVYVVKKGDTLSAIAAKYKTTWQALAKKNKIKDPNLIYPGQKIVISGTAKVPAAPVMKKVVYTVKKGDTLSGIAAKHGTTYQRLAKANKIKNPDLIYPGQKIEIV